MCEAETGNQFDLPENFAIEIVAKTINRLQTFFGEDEKDELFMIMGTAAFFVDCGISRFGSEFVEGESFTKNYNRSKGLKRQCEIS
jgi:hypothetical protein